MVPNLTNGVMSSWVSLWAGSRIILKRKHHGIKVTMGSLGVVRFARGVLDFAHPHDVLMGHRQSQIHGVVAFERHLLSVQTTVRSHRGDLSHN